MDDEFKITCPKCGSNNCNIQEDGDYSYDDEWEWVVYGHVIVCQDCGHRN